MSKQTLRMDVAGQLEDAYLALKYVEGVIDNDPKQELPQLNAGQRYDLTTAIALTLQTAPRLEAPFAAKENAENGR